MKSIRLFLLFASVVFVHGLLGMEEGMVKRPEDSIEQEAQGRDEPRRIEDSKFITLGAERFPVQTYMTQEDAEHTGKKDKSYDCLTPRGLATLCDYFPEELQVKISQHLMKDHPVVPVILQKLEMPPVRVLESNSFVNSVAWNPDGSKVVTGSNDGTAKIWDANTGACLRTLTRHTDLVNSVAWRPDGLRIVTGSDDNTAKIWNTITGACRHTLTGHTSRICSATWSPDGSKVVTGSRDKTAKIWDTITGACLRTLTRHTKSVNSVAWSPDGSKVVTGSFDYTAKIWDVTTGGCLRTLTGHGHWILSVAWSPDGLRIVTGSRDNTAKIWDTITGSCQQTLTGHTSWVGSVVWSPDGSQVVTGSDDRTAKIWDANTGACLHTIADGNWISSVAWSPNGSRIVTGYYGNKTVKIWDVSKLIGAQKNLTNYQILNHALLLDLIYKEAIAKKKELSFSSEETKLFHMLPPEVQEALKPHVKLARFCTII